MDFIEKVIHHLSPSQLRALFLLSKSPKGLISSSNSSKSIGKEGKALGGVFSSLVRHKINGETIVIPWGKSENGRGLNWRLNTKLISQERLKKVVSEMINYG
ncbi:MAG: hypothetical protein WC744_02195 [Patescibacteria group bacterium]|jgi:hypothetical protein